MKIDISKYSARFFSSSSVSIGRIPLGFSERRLLLLMGDLLVLAIAYVIGIKIWTLWRPDIKPPFELFTSYLGWFSGLAAVWLVLLASSGAYNLKLSAQVRAISHRIMIVFVIFVVGYLLFFFLTANQPYLIFSPSIFGEIGVLRVLPISLAFGSFSLGLVWRWFYATQLTKGYFRRHLLIVGAGKSGQKFLDAYREEQQSHSIQIIGFIDDDPHKQASSIEGFPVLARHTELARIAVHYRVDEIVLAIGKELGSGMFQAIMECFELGIRVTPMPIVYENLTGRIPVEHVGKHWYVSLPVGTKPPGRLYMITMRGIDLLFACIGLAFLCATIPLVWCGNAIWSRGPLFYRQQRIGRGGRNFTIIKFRSMLPDAEKMSGAVWATERDPRITLFGNFLRKTRLDETPQFWNVLVGDMSLIGPRPERPEFVDMLSNQIPFYSSRHAVKPGLTGWAQVRYRYGASVEDALLKLQYDLYYIKHQSFWLNLLIIYKTIRVVLGMQGR